MAFKVQGNVTLSSIGVSRRLRFHRTDTGALLVEDASAGDGTYDTDVGYSGSVLVTVDRDYGEAWQASTVYPLNALVIPTVPNGHWYKATSLATGENPATWNPSDKSSNITLSENNLKADGTSVSSGIVRSTTSFNTGKLYFEVEATNVPAGTATWSAGVALSTHVLTNSLGFSAGNDKGWGYWNGGQKAHNGNSAFGDTFTNGDIIGIAVDIDAGKIWFAKNNVWQASGDPAAGSNPAFTNLTGLTLFAAACPWTTGAESRGRFKTDDFTYSPPSGFLEWGPTNVTGSVEPTWPTDLSSVVDGDITWTDQGQMERPLVHGPVIPVVV